MKIDKKLIKELTEYLSEFNLSELEYQDGDKKIKVSKTVKSINDHKNTGAVISGNKTVLANKEIGKRDPIKFFNNYIPKEKCVRFLESGSSFFTTRADLLNEELIAQAKKGNSIYSVVD